MSGYPWGRIVRGGGIIQGPSEVFSLICVINTQVFYYFSVSCSIFFFLATLWHMAFPSQGSGPATVVTYTAAVATLDP